MNYLQPFHYFAVENIDSEDVCDLILDPITVAAFEKAIDEQVTVIFEISYFHAILTNF